jgi:predicted nucleotidyltransferase
MQAPVIVPNILERKRIPNKAIDSLVSQISEKFSPEKIILFGSYAWGNPGPESDVDLLVIMNTSLSEAEQATQICQ